MKLLIKLLKIDDNLLSFLCGIFSNIPITLLFVVVRYEKSTYWDKIYMWLSIILIIMSFGATVFIFLFTLRKLRIQKEVDKMSEIDKENCLLTEAKNNKKYFYISLIGFLICAISLISILISLWCISNINM